MDTNILEQNIFLENKKKNLIEKINIKITNRC